MERSVTELLFGEVMRRRREELGLSQEEVAHRLKRDATRISKVETGQTYRRMPDQEEFLLWCEALELDPIVALRQMGYIQRDSDLVQPPEYIFASLADEIRSAEQMPAESKEAALDGIKHARRLYDAYRDRR